MLDSFCIAHVALRILQGIYR